MLNTVALIVVSFLLAICTVGAVPVVPNPSFQSNGIASGAGYGGISSWTTSNPLRTGLNPAGGQSPFADNGIIPDGSQVAFLQVNGDATSLSTNVNGLTAGTTYRIDFRANSRVGVAPDQLGPRLKVFVGATQVPFSYNYAPPETSRRIPSVGTGKPYHFISFIFTATSTQASLRIEASGTEAGEGGDRSLLIDHFTIVEDSGIVVRDWTGDASSGLSSETTRWAYHFGSGATLDFNGMPVIGILDPSASAEVITPDFTLSGPANRTADANSLTGGDPVSSVIASNFFFNGPNSQITVGNLTAGTSYVLSLLTVRWQNDVTALDRVVRISSGATSRLLSTSAFPSDAGIRIDIPFTPTSSSHTITVKAENAGGATFHFYGMILNNGPFLVTTANDSGPGSLREAIGLAQSRSGPNLITFASNLDGQSIDLIGGHLEIPSNGSLLTIDASGLPGGLTLDAGGNSRVMEILHGAEVQLKGLVFTGGVAAGQGSERFGGAIHNDHGELTLDLCTLRGNSASHGGAIFNNAISGNASLTLSRCTISGNSGSAAGAGIYNDGSRSGDAVLTIDACTISGNSGQGIYNDGFEGVARMSLSQSTITGNSTSGIANDGPRGVVTAQIERSTISRNHSPWGGGGIWNRSSGGSVDVGLTDSILAGNTSPAGPDLFNSPDDSGGATTVSAAGSNVISSLNGQDSLSAATPGIIVGEPHLSKLGDYGGPTQTMLPLPGSSAFDAALTSTATTDQRGFPRPVGAARDIGAAESPNWSKLSLEDHRKLYPLDLDGDGTPYGVELATGGDPFTPFGDDAGLKMLEPGKLTFRYRRDPPFGSLLYLTRSATLAPGSFVEVVQVDSTGIVLRIDGDPSSGHSIVERTITYTQGSSVGPKMFYRLEAYLP